MRPERTPAIKQLDAWRGQPAQHMDPVRFAFISALARRAEAHDGQARRLLDQRLSNLVDAYAADLKQAPLQDAGNDTAQAQAQAAPEAMGALLAHIAGYAVSRDDAITTRPVTAPLAAFPELPALDEFQKLWTTVRTESQFRQSLEQVPADAGPLNSAILVHRAITLMRELSPVYLQQFLSYVDALSWMEQMQGDGLLSAPEAPLTTPAKKPARSRSRKRKDG